MKIYRESLGKAANQLSGGFRLGGFPFLSLGIQPGEGSNQFWSGTGAWLALLLIWLVLSVPVLRYLHGDVLQCVFAAQWGFFIGGTMLIFLHPKLLITVLGGIAGSSLTNLAGLSTVIDKMAAAILAIVASLNKIAPGVLTVQTTAAWIFFILIAICCLPAYKDQ